MVKEHRELDRSGTRKGHIVIKVTYIYIYIFSKEFIGYSLFVNFSVFMFGLD